MIETCHLENFVIFIQRLLSFVLSRKIINIYSNIAQKYGIATVKDFQKYEKLEHKKDYTKYKHQLSQQLQATCCVSLSLNC